MSQRSAAPITGRPIRPRASHQVLISWLSRGFPRSAAKLGRGYLFVAAIHPPASGVVLADEQIKKGAPYLGHSPHCRAARAPDENVGVLTRGLRCSQSSQGQRITL